MIRRLPEDKDIRVVVGIGKTINNNFVLTFCENLFRGSLFKRTFNVDFGTTFSGFSIGHVEHPAEVEVYSSWLESYEKKMSTIFFIIFLLPKILASILGLVDPLIK